MSALSRLNISLPGLRLCGDARSSPPRFAPSSLHIAVVTAIGADLGVCLRRLLPGLPPEHLCC
jgi:hypothetical protein